MAERAHPDDPAFQDKWRVTLKRGLLPWITFNRNPYRAAVLWRYGWINSECKGKDVLDIPCGMGWGTSLIKDTKSLVGLDLSREAIEEATGRYADKATFRVGDMTHLDLPDSSVDLVSCLEGIEHVPKEVGLKFLQQCVRVIRPNGLLMISSPFCRTAKHSGNPYHIHEYQPDEIRQVISQYFEIESIVSRDVDIMTVLYLKCRRLCK